VEKTNIMPRIAGLLAASLTVLSLTACDMFSGPGKKPITGERIAVLPQGRGVEADERIASLPVTLPPQTENLDWPQPGGYSGEYIPHPAASGFTVAWRASIGSGNSRDGRISSSPIVAAGRVYAVDAGARLSAIDASTGRGIWTFDLAPDEDRSGGGSGGGAAFDQGKVYVATGYAQIVALEADKGKELWRTSLTAPFRSGPTTGHNRVYAISSDNQVHSLDAATGRKMWSHSGISENAGLYGGSSPVLSGNILIAALSSGEIFALRGDNGRVLWSDSLAGIQRADAVSALADVRGFPIVDRNQVIAASHAGRLVDIDLRSGARIWEQNFGSFNTPWVAGDFLFMITIDAELICISRRDGRVRWVRQLRKWDDEDAKKGIVTWVRPILAGERLFVANSLGDGLVVAPDTGDVLSKMSLPGPVSVSPVVANHTVFVLTDDATLLALR
jgi:outer membrane protein assembly factor BamB